MVVIKFLLLFGVVFVHQKIVLADGITNITTSSVSVICSNCTFEYTKNGENDSKIQSSGYEVTGLENGQKYNFHIISSGNQTWSSSIVTGKCADGWVGHKKSCYKIVTENPVTWENAMKNCKEIMPGAHLADIKTLESNRFLTKYMIKRNFLDVYWIGVHKDEITNNFTYSDGTVVENLSTFTNASDPLTNDCVMLFGFGDKLSDGGLVWQGAGCVANVRYICEHEIPATPQNIKVDVTSSTASVTWDDIEGNNYIIQGSEYPVTVEDKSEFTSSNNSYNIPLTLNPGACYYITMATRLHPNKEVISAFGTENYFVTKPLPPFAVEIDTPQPTSVNIYWNTVMDNNKISWYEIRYAVSSNKLETNVIVNAQNTWTTLNNLEPNTEYYVVLSAVSSHVTPQGNVSISSDAKEIITFQTPVSPVLNLTVGVASVNEKSFNVQWNHPPGDVDKYLILLQPKHGSEKIFYADDTDTSYHFTDLIPGEMYMVKIATIAGNISSDYVKINQATRPLQPEHLMIGDDVSTTSVEITIFWPKASAKYPQIYFDGFEVVFAAKDSDLNEVREVSIINETSHRIRTFTGLIPGESYMIYIYSLSYGVQSSKYVNDNVTMALSPPSDFRMVGRNETALELAWSPSTGVFENYQISCEECAVETCPFHAQFRKVGEEFFTVQNMIPGNECSFTLVSKKGSQRTSAAISLHLRTMPSTADDFTVNMFDKTYASFSWKNPESIYDAFEIQLDALDGYKYIQRPRRITAPVDITDMGDVGSRVVSNLVPGISYNCSLYTISDGVYSHPTRVKFATWPETPINISADAVTETSMTVRWLPGTGGYIGFNVVVYLQEEQLVIYNHNVTNVTVVKVPDVLKPSTIYFVALHTLTKHFRSYETNFINVQTRPTKPTEIYVYNITTTNCSIEWTKPSSNYDHFNAVLENDKEEARSFQLPFMSVPLTMLTPGAVYKLSIASVYNDIESFNTTTSFTMFPLPPENITVGFINSTSITISWNKPFGHIGHYIASSKPASDEIKTAHTDAYFTNLTPGVKYEFTVYSVSFDNETQGLEPAYTATSTNESLPSAPLKLVTSSTEKNSIKISWNLPRHPNGKILLYSVAYKQLFPHPQEFFTTVTVSADVMKSTAENLEPGAYYLVHVAAQNSAGIGEISEEIQKVAESLPSQVDQLQVVPLNSTSIKISWFPPLQPNGRIEKYFLKISSDNAQEIISLNYKRNKDGNPLVCFLEYAPKVDVKEFLSAIGYEIDDLTFENNVELIATIKNLNNGTFPNLFDLLGGKNLDVVDDSSSSSEILYTFEPNCPVSYVATGLKPYTYYKATVMVSTAGFGDTAEAGNYTMPEAPGGPPQNFIAIKTNKRSLQFVWEPPRNPNGIVTYTIILLSDEHPFFRVFSTNNKYFEIDLLQPYHTYAVTIAAETSVGLGPWLPWKLLNTNEDAPSIPINLGGEALSSTSITLTWSPPLPSNGELLGYQLSFFENDKPVGKPYFIEAKRESMPAPKYDKPDVIDYPNFMPSISNNITLSLGLILSWIYEDPVMHITNQLEPYTLYTIHVSATNAAGVGESAVVGIETKESIPGIPSNLKYQNLSSTSINVTWGAPIKPNGIIIGYTVYFIFNDEMYHKDTTNTYYVFNNLEKYHEYRVHVAAKTVVGLGNSTKNLYIYTGEDAPDSPPRYITYTNISSSIIKVNWQEPEKPNGKILAYSVYYSNTTAEYVENSTDLSLYIHNLRPYGEYKLKISSWTLVGEGVASKEIYIRTSEYHPTTPPYDLAYTNESSTSINLTWSEPLELNGRLKIYEIVLVPLYNEQENRSLSAVSRHITIGNLIPFSTYQAYVKASTEVGDGRQVSEPLTIYTMEDVPSSAPRNPAYKNKTSTSILLSWDPPQTPNGIIIMYNIYYVDKKIKVNEESLEIGNLKMYSNHEFKISASTIAGEGPSVSLSIHTAEDEPSSPPYDVVYKQNNSTSVTLNWKPPVSPNGIIILYNIRYGNESYNFTATSTSTEAILSNLMKFGSYWAYVTASTRHGDGKQRSEIISFRTLQDAPSDPPKEVIAEAISSTEIQVSWKPPSFPNGIIQFYTVYFSGVNGVVDSKKVNNTTSTVLENLEKYTLYEIYVTGSTALGDGGQKSDIITVKTLIGVPDAPVNGLRDIVKTSSSIELVWEPALPTTGPTYFKVYIKTDFDKDFIFNAKTNNTNFVLTKLQPFVDYEIMVTPFVHGIDGKGPPSTIIVKTLQSIPGSPVEDLRVTNISSTAAVVYWNPPLIPNGIITNYTIISKDITKVVAGNKLSATLTGLSKFMKYTVKVIPHTIVGKGPEKSESFKTSSDVPDDSARNMKIFDITSSSASIKWEPPQYANGIIVSYLVQYTWNTLTRETQVTTEQCILDNLLPFTSYSVKIFAATAVGFGPNPSSPIQFKTEEDLPGPPSSLSCLAKSESEILLQWKEPEMKNGILTDYKIVQIGNNSSNTIMQDEKSNQYSFVKLLPFTKYTFQIFAQTSVGFGPELTCANTTLQSLPGSPLSLDLIKSGSTFLHMSWSQPSQMNGILDHYLVHYHPPDNCQGGLLINDKCELRSSTKDYEISQLTPFKSYNVAVAAVNGKGIGVFSKTATFTTKIGVPEYPPTDINVLEISPTSIKVTWSPPRILAGPTQYQVTVINSGNGETSESEMLDGTKHTISGLESYTDYEVFVSAITQAGSKRSVGVEVTTTEDAPAGPPRAVTASALPKNSTVARIHYMAPYKPNGLILKYTLQYRQRNSNDITTVDILANKDINSGKSQWWYVYDLRGGRQYVFRMNAVTKIGSGPWSDWTDPVLLPINAPPKPTEKPVALAKKEDKNAITSTTIKINNLCMFSNVHGHLSSISVVVAQDGSDLDGDIMDWHAAYKEKISPPYKVVATVEPNKMCGNLHQDRRRKRDISDNNSSTPFVIGNDDTCFDVQKAYCNGPLKTDTGYRVKLRAETVDGKITDTEYSDVIKTDLNFLQANYRWIAGLCGGVFVFLLVLMITCCVMRKRKNIPDSSRLSMAESQGSRNMGSPLDDSKKSSSNLPVHENLAFIMEPADKNNKLIGTVMSRPIPKQKFNEHVKKMSQQNQKGFVIEYGKLKEVKSIGTTEDANMICNKTKNRYSTAVPYDQSRVKLESVPNVAGSDYINASYIPGFRSQEQFIATQIPLNHTQKDLWRMVWESGCNTMVLLTENNKDPKKQFSDFWPHGQVEYFGNLAVQNIREDVKSDWITRHFHVTKRDKVRQVTMYQFEKWEPLTPESKTALLHFVQAVRSTRTVDSPPEIVMCSSGCGKTAVYMALNILVDINLYEKQIDVLGVVAGLRKHRANMVQNTNDYIFIHQCVNEIMSIKSSTPVPPTDDEPKETTMF